MSGVWRPGRDPLAVRHRPAPPDGDASTPRRVAVVGGGIAGLTAATALAERGIGVVLIEREAQLGGRVRSWPVGDISDPRTMSRGFHAFFRQYYNLRALLRRTDPGLQRLLPLSDYPLVSAGGARDSFSRVPRTPPWSFAAFVALSETFRVRDLAQVDIGAAFEMLAVDFPATYEAYDGESADQFLDRLHFPDAARHLALEVFARSFFAHPQDFAAGELVAMFHSYFLGSAEGLLFDVPDDDYDTTLWSPLAEYLRGLGVELRLGEQATGIELTDDRVRVSAGDETVDVDGVVLALDPAALRSVVLGSDIAVGSDAGRAWRDRVDAVRTAPPFGVLRLWLDRPVRADRSAFLGTTGFGDLDNVSVVERFEQGAAEWSRRHGGSVVEVHAYAADRADLDTLPNRLRAQLDTVLPEVAGLTPVAQEWLLREDCWLLDSRPWRDRVSVQTPDPRIRLAGDGVRCDLPVALMERAATTGFLAANDLLARFGREGHDLWTVPMRGRHAAVRRFIHGPSQRSGRGQERVRSS